MKNQCKTWRYKYGIIFSVILLCAVILPQNLYALESSEILETKLLEAANTVGTKTSTDYQKALVLRYFDKIKALREDNKINNETFQKTMAWFRITHLQIATKAASNKGFNAVEQRVSNDAAEYRVRSDTDILLSRKKGSKPITLEDVQAVEREHRRLLKAITRKLAKNANKSIDISGDFKTDADFMVPPDLTTPTEFERLKQYFAAKGSATYRRPDAARVEAKLRKLVGKKNNRIGIKEGSQYVDEMMEQIANAKTPKGREKYVKRINDLNERLMQQVGLTLSAEGKINSSNFATKALQSHIKILGEVANSTNSTPKARQQARFIIALKLYDLPNTQKESLLRKLPSQFQKEVKNEIKKFKEEAPGKSDVFRVQSFLQKTARGRKLLAKYNWVFKELTKERGQKRNNSASIADIYSSLGKTSRHVGNYAHSINLWMNVIRQVRDAKTDADLAIALGKTLASKTYYGMIADQLYTSLTDLSEGNLTKAGTGAVKFVTLLYCPEVAIPEVVQSIGDSTIDITSSILFDKQFMALYLASKFDPQNGTLLSIGDYHGKAPACQFIDDALIPGGHRLISGIFDDALKLAKKKNLSVEAVSGINTLGRRALIKAITSTIYNGKPLMLQSYPPLVSACSDVEKLTNNINDFTEGLGYHDKIPRNVEASWLDKTPYFQNLEPAAKRPLKSLLTLRSDAWKKVKKNLCAGITKNIISRHKAELALNKDSGKEANKLHKRIETIFKELKIYTFGMKRLEADGATNIIMRNFITSRKDQQIKAMQALQRYLVNYERVLRYRQQAEAYYKLLTGQSLARRPLTITPPLAVEPEFDASLGASYMEEILSSISRIQKKWLRIKRKALNDKEAELDSNFDKEILTKYYIEIFFHAYAATVMKGSSHALNPPSSTIGLPLRIVTGELFKDLRYQSLHDAAFETTQETWEKRKKLNEEFKDHYRNIKNILSINLPVEIKDGQGIAGSPYYFSTKTINIPDEATFIWFKNDKKIATGDSMAHSFEKAGKYQLRVVASWKKSERITNKGSIEAKANFQIKESKQLENRTDTGDVNKDKGKDNKNTIDTGDRVKPVPISIPIPEKNNRIEKEWIAKIEDTHAKKEWQKLLELHSQLLEENRQKYHSSFITQSPYLAPAKLLGKYLKEFAQIKWDWFKNDVSRYLSQWERQSEGKYGELERKVTHVLLKRNGTQEDADKCLEDAKKEARATRKSIRQAKKEHSVVMQKMFDDQGNSVKILTGIKGFLNKYDITETLKVSVEYSSSCVDNDTKIKNEKLKVKISGTRMIIASAKEAVTLNAEVTGGQESVNISWEGENISPSGSRAIFAASKPGTYTVQVTAKDADGQSVSDSVTIRVRKKIEPSLYGLKDTVYYGKTYPITVGIPAQKPQENKPLRNDPCKSHKQTQNPFDPCNKTKIDRDSNGNKVSEFVPDPSKEGPYDIPPIADTETGEYVYVWQPTGGGGLEFNPPSGSNPKVNVTFGNIGDIEIWAEVHKNGEKAGETKPIQTKVIPPKFTLHVSPAAPYVGEESKATIDVQPDIDNKYLNFRWLPMGNNIQELGESNDGRAYRFKTKSKKSSKIEVLVWAEPYAEEQIADLKQVVSAKPYQVKVKVLGPLGPKPMVWKEGKGLVKVDSEIAVHQNVRLEAQITPEPKDTTLRYSWKLNEDSHFTGRQSGKDVMLNRSQTGSCVATVTVTDKDGNVLGKGSGSFSVSISQKQIDSGKQKENDQKKAQKLLKKGRALWKEGKIQQAIARIAQAQKLAVKDNEIVKTHKAMQRQKRDLDSKLKEVVKLIKTGKLQKAEEMLSKASRVNDKYPKYKEVLKQLSNAKRRAAEKKRKLDILLKDAKALKNAGKLNEAATVLKKGSKAFPTNKEIGKLLKDVQKQQSDAHAKMQEGQSKWKNGLLDKAISTLKTAAKIDPSNKQITKALEGMQAQKKTMDHALKKAAKLIKQKKLKQAWSALKKAERISSNYPPYVEMLTKLDAENKIRRILKEAKQEWEKHKSQVAISKLEKILKIDSDYTDAITLKKKWQDILDKRTVKPVKPGIISGTGGKIVTNPEKIPINKVNGQTITATFNPPSSANAWERYSISLTADKFGVDTNTFRSVLSNVSTFRIRTEMHDGDDVGGIDNVKIGNTYFSNFHSGADGWNAAGDGTMEWISSGGISGGFLQISDWASGEWHWAVAPANWSGDWQALIGKKLDFYFKTDHPDYSAVVEISSKQQNRLGLLAKPMVISKGGSALVFIAPYPTSSKDLAISLTSSNKKCMSVLENIILPVGQEKVETEVKAVNVASECNSVIEASAEGYGKSRITLSVKKAARSKHEVMTQKVDNIDRVTNKPRNPTFFKFDRPVKLLYLRTYHWNNGQGKSPGSIGLRHNDGTLYGLWQTHGRVGQGSVQNAYWQVNPLNIHLKAGVYTVVDSDPETWSTNAKAGWKGFATIKVEPITMVSGKTKSSTSYAPNTKGDVFKGGHWAGASGQSDWLQKDFTSPQYVTGVYVGEASTDITTEGFKLVLKLRKPNGEWITIDKLHDTNINRTALSGGAIGKSILPYTKTLSTPVEATAFRLEFYGHGWFDATDIRIYTGNTDKSHINKPHKTPVSNQGAPHKGSSTKRNTGGSIRSGNKGSIRNPSQSVTAHNGTDSLSLPKSIFEPGEKIALSFKASSNYPEKSWIGMFKADLPHDGMNANNNKELAYHYLENNASDTFKFTAPTKEGDYDFRMFEKSNSQEMVTIAFSVKVDQEVAQLTLPKNIFEPGDKIALSFKASPNYPEKSWIGMFKADLSHDGMNANNNKELAYHYLENNASGTFKFTAPTKEGDYDFRMFEKSNGQEMVTINFKVLVDKNVASLSLPKTVYEPGEKIKLNFKASPEYPNKSWVGMFNASLPHGNLAQVNNKELAFKYLEGKSSGTFEFTAPEKEGKYDFRVLEKSNGLEVATIKFKVIKSTASEEEKDKSGREKSNNDLSSLIGSWSFGRSKHYGKPVHEHLCDLVLTDKFVKGIGYKIKSCNSNESYWILERNTLLFVALDGTITTRFKKVKHGYWEGTYIGSTYIREGVVHYLKKSDEEALDTSGIDGIVDIDNTMTKEEQSEYIKRLNRGARNKKAGRRIFGDKTKTSTTYVPNDKGRSDKVSIISVPTGGYWKLSNTIIYTNPDINSECYKGSISLSNGKVSSTTSVYKKDCNWHYDESITFIGSWSPPPVVLIPSNSYPMHVNISRSNPVNQWSADDYINIYMDAYDTGCGASTRSAQDVTDEYIKIGWRASNPSSNSWSGSLVAPKYKYAGSGETNKFQVKVSVRDGCARYIYDWIPKDAAVNTTSQH